jgi:hypothetical protein
VKVRGREVDDGAAVREPVAQIHERALDAVDALPNGHLREPDEDRLGHLGRGRVDLDIDRNRVDAEQGERAELGEHGDLGGRSRCERRDRVTS